MVVYLHSLNLYKTGLIKKKKKKVVIKILSFPENFEEYVINVLCYSDL